ncbi:recombinase family protein [Pumilibacter intestinalis]|uniref:recombinase family protein n=1 Tax=Pumilibacter intestinalis TaxID=2941511 RepID=UPI002040FDA4|nr:recombinase family protein [Pumilibacter intestinalis]
MAKVGIYIYTSRGDVLIEPQMKKLQDYASAHGDVVVNRYLDRGYVGGKRCRAALNRLMQDCAEGKLEKVLVFRVRHLSLNGNEFFKIYKQITENNVALDILEDPVDKNILNRLEIIGVLQGNIKRTSQEFILAGYQALVNAHGSKISE